MQRVTAACSTGLRHCLTIDAMNANDFVKGRWYVIEGNGSKKFEVLGPQDKSMWMLRDESRTEVVLVTAAKIKPAPDV